MKIIIILLPKTMMPLDFHLFVGYTVLFSPARNTDLSPSECFLQSYNNKIRSPFSKYSVLMPLTDEQEQHRIKPSFHRQRYEITVHSVHLKAKTFTLF